MFITLLRICIWEVYYKRSHLKDKYNNRLRLTECFCMIILRWIMRKQYIPVHFCLTTDDAVCHNQWNNKLALLQTLSSECRSWTLSSHIFRLECCFKTPLSKLTSFWEVFWLLIRNVRRRKRGTAYKSSKWANFNQHGNSGKVRKQLFLCFIDTSYLFPPTHICWKQVNGK